MTEQPPSAEAQALAETIYKWQGYAFLDGRVAEAIDALIAQRVSAETERWQNRDRQRLEQIDRLQETAQQLQSASAERPASGDYTERARELARRWIGPYVGPYEERLNLAAHDIAAALSAVASEHQAAAIRAFGQRVWSDTEEVAYQAGVNDTRERLQEPDVREAVEAAINEQRALEAGGCFNPSDETEGECADRDCYCTKQVAREADAAITKITEMLR